MMTKPRRSSIFVDTFCSVAQGFHYIYANY